MADSALARELAQTVRDALAEAARYLALVTETNPYGSADDLLRRPDVTAVLQEALDEARSQAAAVVAQVWENAGAEEHPVLRWLLGDVERQLSSVAHLRGLVRHAHASVPVRHFEPGVSEPGSNPAQESAAERAAAVAQAVLEFGRASALKSRLAVSMAEGSAATVATLAEGQRREDGGEEVRKRWRAHIESPTCCHWCRKLNGVTIGLRESFVPHIGGPAALPHQRTRKVATQAGAERYGRRIGSQIIYTHPPRPYHGDLQGPLLHPFCQCWLEIVAAPAREGPSVVLPGGQGHRQRTTTAPPGFLAAADIRALPEARYQALLAFLRAATHELGQLLRRLAVHAG